MHMAGILRDLACQLQALMRGVSRRHRLSLTQAQVLLNLPVDGLPLSSLAHRLGLDISTISRIADKMAQRQWVRREVAADDKRVNRVVPTEEGQALYRQLSDSLDDEVKTLLAGLDGKRQESLGQHLEELTWRMLQQRTR